MSSNHFRYVLRCAVCAILIGAADASAKAEATAFDCESHGVLFEGTGKVLIVFNKASGTVREIDFQRDGGGQTYDVESVTIEGDLVKASKDGTTLELNVVTGRGARFLLNELIDRLLCARIDGF